MFNYYLACIARMEEYKTKTQTDSKIAFAPSFYPTQNRRQCAIIDEINRYVNSLLFQFIPSTGDFPCFPILIILIDLPPLLFLYTTKNGSWSRPPVFKNTTNRASKISTFLTSALFMSLCLYVSMAQSYLPKAHTFLPKKKPTLFFGQTARFFSPKKN